LPFTREQFLAVLAEYNRAIWPTQVAAYVLAALTIALAVRRTGARAVGGILGGLWVFTGVGYHWLHFAHINKAAFLFDGLFVAQGLLFLALAARQGLAVALRPTRDGLIGAALVSYAAIICPALNHFLGHVYPRSPSFGLTPCPLTSFTFGVLLWAARPTSLALLVIPSLWALVGLSAATRLGMVEDFALPLAALTATALVATRRQRPVAEKEHTAT
jgi:hypothetical protein